MAKNHFQKTFFLSGARFNPTLRNRRFSKSNELCQTLIIRNWVARIIHMTLQFPESHLCHEDPLYLFSKNVHAKKKKKKKVGLSCITENSKDRFTCTEKGAHTRRMSVHSRGQQAMKMTITYANFIRIKTKEGNQGRQRIINWLAVRLFALNLRVFFIEAKVAKNWKNQSRTNH